MATTELTLPDTTKADSEASTFLQLAKEFIIADAADSDAAAACLKDIKGLMATITGDFEKTIQAAHAAHKAAIAQRDQHLKPLNEAWNIIKSKMSIYIAHEEQKRLAEARAAQAEADRIAREQQAEAEKKARAERDARAAELRKQGDAQAAKALKAAPIVVEPIVAPIVAPQAPAKVAGISAKTVWKFAVEDAAQLPREYTSPDMQKIGAVVKAMGGETRISGVRVWPEKQVSVR